MKNILWLGCIASSEADLTKTALSPAADKWQRSFIEELIELGYEISVISHLPCSVWPKGPIWVKGASYISDHLLIKNISYLNLALLRHLWIAIGSLFSMCTMRFDIKQVIAYNFSAKSLLLFLLARQKRIQTVLLFADGKRLFWAAQAVVHFSFSSWHQADFGSSIRSKQRHILFPPVVDQYFSSPLESNANKVLYCTPSGKPYLLYSGSINTWTGIIEFISDFADSKLSLLYDLVVTGSGTIPSSAYNDMSSAVVYLGFISKSQLDQIAASAVGFINPRPCLTLAQQNNFPSKLIYYFSFDAPVFSSPGSNIHPEFAQVLSFYNTIDEILEILLDHYYLSSRISHLKLFRLKYTWHAAVSSVLKGI